jgi:hypothetical protein
MTCAAGDHPPASLPWRSLGATTRRPVTSRQFLEAWRAADHKLWDRQEHGRRRALGHRKDLYRQVGAAVAGQAELLVVDDINVAAIAGSVGTRDDVPASVQQIIDRRRDYAAPGKLREAVAAAARSNGVQLDVVPASQGIVAGSRRLRP